VSRLVAGSLPSRVSLSGPIDEDSPLELKIVDAGPEDSVAIRLGRPHDDGPADRRARMKIARSGYPHRCDLR